MPSTYEEAGWNPTWTMFAGKIRKRKFLQSRANLHSEAEQHKSPHESWHCLLLLGAARQRSGFSVVHLAASRGWTISLGPFCSTYSRSPDHGHSLAKVVTAYLKLTNFKWIHNSTVTIVSTTTTPCSNGCTIRSKKSNHISQVLPHILCGPFSLSSCGLNCCLVVIKVHSASREVRPCILMAPLRSRGRGSPSTPGTEKPWTIRTCPSGCILLQPN